MKKFNNIAEIKEAKIKYRDDKVIYNLLNVIIGELDRLPTRTEPNEDQIYSIIKRMYENAMIMKEDNRDSAIEAFFLKDFIKKQLSDSELVNIIMQYKEDGLKNIGDYMRALNTEYKGQFDGKMASDIIKKLI
jgi:uncharacterized protein YqeY